MVESEIRPRVLSQEAGRWKRKRHEGQVNAGECQAAFETSPMPGIRDRDPGRVSPFFPGVAFGPSCSRRPKHARGGKGSVDVAQRP